MAEGSKTEKATPKKRRDERKKGNVFMSKDAVAVAIENASGLNVEGVNVHVAGVTLDRSKKTRQG